MTGARGVVLALVLGVTACTDRAGGPPDSAPTPEAPTPESAAPTEASAEAPDATSEPTDPVSTEAGTDSTTIPEFDRSLPAGDEPVVLGPLGSADADFATGDERVQVGSAEIPELAAGVPLPDDLDVQLASEREGAIGFSGVSPSDFDTLVGFFDEELPAAGYTAERSRFVEGVVAVFDFAGAEVTGQVAIARAPGGASSVVVTLTQ